MATTLQDLGIDRLSIEERIALAQAIDQSVALEVESTLLTEGQRQELERRLADSIERPEAVISWDQVKAEALARTER